MAWATTQSPSTPVRGRVTTHQADEHSCGQCPVVLKSAQALGSHRRVHGGQTERRNWARGDECDVPGCGRPVAGRGICGKHYNRWHRGMPVEPGLVHRLDSEVRLRSECSVEGCPRARTKTTELCEAHRQRQVKHGSVKAERPLLVRGARRYVDTDGYVVIPRDGHSNGGKNGSMFEHVKVMSEKIGRPLLPGEQVHHRNGVRDDNRPENLELWRRAQPRGCRVADLVRYAHEILRTYGDDSTPWETT